MSESMPQTIPTADTPEENPEAVQSDPCPAWSKVRARRTALEARDALSSSERRRRSERACEELLTSLEAPLAQEREQPFTVALYAAMGSEVNLEALAYRLQDRGARIAYPVMLAPETGEDENAAPKLPVMGFFATTDQCRESTWNSVLSQPLRKFTEGYLVRKGLTRVAPDKLDAVIVPLVGFDDAGRRLGYGGGCYDRLLPRFRADCLVMGVAFEEQRLERVPREAHDLPLPHIVVV